jgi:hypothetical protein
MSSLLFWLAVLSPRQRFFFVLILGVLVFAATR